MNGIDIYMLETFFSMRDPAAVLLLKATTELGSTLVVGSVALAVGLHLLLRAQLSNFAGLCVSIMGAVAIVFPLKEIVARARPDAYYQAFLENGFALPSGHAALSIALYGFIGYLIWQSAPNKIVRYFALCIVAALIAVIGFSRLYLGLHYLSDVLAGYAIGALCLALGIWVSERFTRHPIWS